jgi:cytochrome c oxidase cbb3-type subunit 3
MKKTWISLLVLACCACSPSVIPYNLDKKDVQAGSLIFRDNCTPCHGFAAQGIVGPNLTDNHWIHGGGSADILKTITYGVPEKGMISWKDQLKQSEIQQVAAYIMSLHDSKPANAKAAQGTFYNNQELKKARQ